MPILAYIVNFQIHISVGRTILLIFTGGVGRRDTRLYRPYLYICRYCIYLANLSFGRDKYYNNNIVYRANLRGNISHVPRFYSPVIPAAVCVGLLFFLFFILFTPWPAEDDRPSLQQWCLP